MKSTWILRVVMLVVFFAMGANSGNCCASLTSDIPDCLDNGCADEDNSTGTQDNNDSPQCCCHYGACIHASFAMNGDFILYVPSRSDTGFSAYHDQAPDGPVFGIDRPPQVV